MLIITVISIKEGLTPVKEEKILIQIDTVPHKFKYIPDIKLIKRKESQF